uniref:Uncharacterized protein n=1 Tax=Amorphochlora amoebiformis TaxID=1561963 RepID=A0A7S0DGA7_9EUKA
MGELIIICNIRKCGLWMCCSVMDPNRRPQTSWDAEVRNVQFSAEVMTFAASLGNHDKDELKGGMQGEDEEGTEAPESNESNTQTSILIQSAQPLGIGFDFDSKCPPTRMARTVEMPSLIS